jgi:hypothetical protein
MSRLTLLCFRGNIDLVNWIPMFGSEQLGTLTVVASLLLLSTHGLTAYFVKEKVLVSAPTCVPLFQRFRPTTLIGKTTETNEDGVLPFDRKANTGFMKQLAEIFSNILTLPRVIRQIVRPSLHPPSTNLTILIFSIVHNTALASTTSHSRPRTSLLTLIVHQCMDRVVPGPLLHFNIHRRTTQTFHTRPIPIRPHSYPLP